MIVIKPGERGPRVVLVQRLLAEKGYGLTINGKWDDDTSLMVKAFRKQEGLKAIDTVDGDVMTRLQSPLLRIVDSVDMTPYSGDFCHDSFKELDNADADLVAQTNVPLQDVVDRRNKVRRMVNMTRNSMTEAIRRIIQDVGNRSKIALLRFYAHGHGGDWLTVSAGFPKGALQGDFTNGDKQKGRLLYHAMEEDWINRIDLDHFHLLAPMLRPLAPYLASFASVEHHGCKVGTSGLLLQKLANLWNVPVSGGVETQLAGAWGTTFVFEGTVTTKYPKGQTLQSWAGQIQRDWAATAALEKRREERRARSRL
jgi:hypothetical protein